MPVLDVIEVMSNSSESWGNAVENVINRATKTVRNIRSINVKNLSAVVENNKVIEWRVNCKVTFEVEEPK